MNVCMDRYSGKRGQENFIIFTEANNPNFRIVVEICHPPYGDLGPQVLKTTVEKKTKNSLGEEFFVEVNQKYEDLSKILLMQALIETILMHTSIKNILNN